MLIRLQKQLYRLQMHFLFFDLRMCDPLSGVVLQEVREVRLDLRIIAHPLHQVGVVLLLLRQRFHLVVDWVISAMLLDFVEIEQEGHDKILSQVLGDPLPLGGLFLVGQLALVSDGGEGDGREKRWVEEGILVLYCDDLVIKSNDGYLFEGLSIVLADIVADRNFVGTGVRPIPL